ncbi:GNAT family N-acetyltransferase [Microbispora rosea]|uniref:GNAT family N-acetyltransferase n=1 Tax=Microbispora rosea TaxID=58117 RepID=UPI0006902005|nr:GNAT family N-acetyltransferase [Microbispora rosea]
MSLLTIRRATPEDARLLAELNGHVHGLHVARRPDIYREHPSPDELIALYKDQLSRESVRIFIAELPEGKCVGYASATLQQRAASALMHADSFIVLNELAVAPKATRHGVGTALVNAVREAGRQAGCRRLLTEVLDCNDEARSFYEAAGFLPMKHVLEQLL